MYEGVAKVLLSEMKAGLLSSTRSKIGALLIKPALKKTLKKFDSSQYGGAPIIGLTGLVVKMHGSSKAVEVEKAMDQCVQYREQRIADRIQEYAAGEKKKQDAARAGEEKAGCRKSGGKRSLRMEGNSVEFEKLQQIIADVLSVDVDEIKPETTFRDDLGADSLDVFQIIMGLEEEFSIQIPTEEAEKIVTVGDAADAIAKAVK